MDHLLEVVLLVACCGLFALHVRNARLIELNGKLIGANTDLIDRLLKWVEGEGCTGTKPPPFEASASPLASDSSSTSEASFVVGDVCSRCGHSRESHVPTFDKLWAHCSECTCGGFTDADD